MGRLSDAEAEFRKSEPFFRDTNHAIGIGSVYLAQGEIAFQKEDFFAAEESWKKAKTFFASHSLDLYVKKAQDRLSSLETIDDITSQ